MKTYTTLSFNTGQDETGVVGESYELHSMPNIGFAEREGNIKIRINEDSYNSSKMLKEITDDTSNVALFESLDLSILKGYTWQELRLCHVLSHEIGHALFEISHPLVDWIWGELESYSYRQVKDGETATHRKEKRDDNNDGIYEVYYVEDSSSSATHVKTKIRQAYDIPMKEYRKNINRLNYLYSTNLPHYPGGGHLEGNPSGIWTFAFDKILSKSLFENFIWARVDEVYKEKSDEINESSMSQQRKDAQKDVLSQNRAFIKSLSVPGYLEPVVDNQEPPQPTGGYRLNTYYLGASDSK